MGAQRLNLLEMNLREPRRDHFEMGEVLAILVAKDALVICVTGREESLRDDVIFEVNANDLFYWGCSDGVEVATRAELEMLADLYHADQRWGPVRYCCWKRNMRPQHGHIVHMKEVGAWDEMMEALPLNDAHDDHLLNPPLSVETVRRLYNLPLQEGSV